MKKLKDVQKIAMEHTRQKLSRDIESYLEKMDQLPDFQQYLSDREQYISQIWINVWLNSVTNDIGRDDKKLFLSERGYETEGVSRKLINQHFRTEMRTFEPFDTHQWLQEVYADNPLKWEEKYDRARRNFFKRQEEEQLAVKRWQLQETIEKFTRDFLQKRFDIIYLYTRHFAAQQVADDFKNKLKFQHVDPMALEEILIPDGPFRPSDFPKMDDFFDALTGEIHKTLNWGKSYFEYETYYYKYEKKIRDYLFALVPGMLLDAMKNEIDGSNEKGLFTDQLVNDALIELSKSIFEKIKAEYVEDLLELAPVPFDVETHETIYKKDIEEREKRKAEELAELERIKAEETRMMEDIFGQDFSPSLGRRIRYVLHIGDTNTGKTFHALERMKQAHSGLYLAPLRLLALEVFDKLNDEGTPCSLKTGEEEKLVEYAAHASCTIEIFHEKEFYEVVVIDEAQMLADKDRGYSWFKAITKANAKEVHIIGSRNVKQMLLGLLGNSDVEIHEYKREIPLEVEKKEFTINTVKKGDALICFSRKRVLETASKLQQDGHAASMIYGSMPPETRLKQIQRFINGETKVIVATDAIGMGLNLPIRRVVFLENEKFDGTSRRQLTSQEVKQIAGRAGRKGIYNVGKVAFTKDIQQMSRLLHSRDEPVNTFSIAPTTAMLERFQRYSRDLAEFFELWDKFESPFGTKKAPLTEERELFELLRGTELEARLSLADLYSYLQLPFSSRESALTRQWEQTIYAIVMGEELPEPQIKKRTLEDVELTYKAIGLHLLFLYRLERRTEAVYWERVREETSDQVHERLKTDVKNISKKCKRCGKTLAWDARFPICEACYSAQIKRYSRH
ncbi:MAG: DEAD/DEAH box helicase [Bacillota bacterium]|nr:DEAD/DEAH box helicase [Bacillota bacterium]MDP4170865.1 DEAD/DEAH box helicase [Bacillota bacterium]